MLDYFISTDKNLLDIRVIYEFIHNESYWAKGRDIETIRKSIEHSTLCFGIYKTEGQKQVGFARVITDLTTHAYLADVFVVKEFRGLGLSKMLVETIVNHPLLKDVNKMLLATEDAHTLYEKFGFVKVAKPDFYMQRMNTRHFTSNERSC